MAPPAVGLQHYSPLLRAVPGVSHTTLLAVDFSQEDAKLTHDKKLLAAGNQTREESYAARPDQLLSYLSS